MLNITSRNNSTAQHKTNWVHGIAMQFLNYKLQCHHATLDSSHHGLALAKHGGLNHPTTTTTNINVN